MRIWTANYTLQARSILGVGGSRSRVGALIKVEDETGVGYADIHPWVELGDLPLELQLEALELGQVTPLISRSLALAKLDRQARQQHQNAFEGLHIPESHFLVPSLAQLSREALHDAWTEGFRVLKLKLGRDLRGELDKLLELRAELSTFVLRFDFNSTSSVELMSSFIGSLPEVFRSAIEFIEDPIPWSPTAWAQLHTGTGVHLAIDRLNQTEASELNSSVAWANAEEPSAQWLVVKPAIQDPVAMSRIADQLSLRMAVTTYLDHPIGQYGAALEAARVNSWHGDSKILRNRAASLGVCGLLSHFAFEKNEFTERIIADGPKLLPSEGTGLGFDDLLEKQLWKKLK